jgi:hypothetical protein
MFSIKTYYYQAGKSTVGDKMKIKIQRRGIRYDKVPKIDKKAKKAIIRFNLT